VCFVIIKAKWMWNEENKNEDNIMIRRKWWKDKSYSQRGHLVWNVGFMCVKWRFLRGVLKKNSTYFYHPIII